MRLAAAISRLRSRRARARRIRERSGRPLRILGYNQGLCIGAWTYPSAEFSRPGTHDLPLLFSSADRLPATAPERDLVLMVSAGLARKNWPPWGWIHTIVGAVQLVAAFSIWSG